MAVAGVAAQKVGAAPDLEAQSLPWLEDHWVGGEAEAQRDRFTGGEWLWVADVERDLGRGAARLVDPRLAGLIAPSERRVYPPIGRRARCGR